MDLDLALDLLSLLLLLPELGLLLEKPLLEASLDRLLSWAWLSLGVGAFLEVFIELELCPVQSALLNDERIIFIKILEQRAIVNCHVLFIKLSRDQPIVSIDHLIVACWCLAALIQ